MNITTTINTDGTTEYTAIIDGTDASTLTIWTETREIANIETRTAYQRQGLARALWAHANAEAECFHALDHHRTPEGDAFAWAVGGETIDEETGKVDVCDICNCEYDEEF